MLTYLQLSTSFKPFIFLKVFDISKISVFVLDEADVMIDTQGFREQSIRIHRSLSPTCQFLLFSATFDEQVMRFAQQIVKHPNIIKVSVFFVFLKYFYLWYLL